MAKRVVKKPGKQVATKKPKAPSEPPPTDWRAPADIPALSGLIVASDGRTLAGGIGVDAVNGKGGRHASVLSWGPDGVFAWRTRLDHMSPRPVRLQLADRVLLAYVSTSGCHLDPLTGASLQQRMFMPGTLAAALSHDGSRLILRKDRETHVFDLPPGGGSLYLTKLAAAATESPLVMSSDGRHFAICGPDVHVFATATNTPTSQFTPQGAPIVLAFTPSGDLVTADREGRVCIFTIAGDRKREVTVGTAAAISAVAVSARGAIAIATEDGTVRIADAETIVATHPHAPPVGSVIDVAFSPDGGTLWVNATASGAVGLSRFTT